MNRRSSFLVGFAIALTVAMMIFPGPGTAQSTPQPVPRKAPVRIKTMEKDLASRSPDIHWPEGFDPAKAELFAHNEVLINAPCEQVWGHIIEAPAWPTWYPNSQDVQLSDPGATVLGKGSVFTWKTFGSPLESRVDEFLPYSRISWYGGSHGQTPLFYHTFYLKSDGDGCRVVTEEVGHGPMAEYVRKNDEGLLHRGHDLLLATLKWVSEK